MEELEEQIPDWLCPYLVHAFIGEFYSNIIAVAIGYTKNDDLTIRYYLDREPNDFDFESIETVATNLDSSLPRQINSLNVECMHCKEKHLRDVDPLSGFFYSIRNYDLG